MRKNDVIRYMRKQAAPIRYLISIAPEDKYEWSPADNMMNLGKLIAHLARSYAVIWIVFDRLKKVPDEYMRWDAMQREDALKMLDRELEAAVKAVSKISEEDYLESSVKTFWGAEDKYCNILMLLIDHAIHHKMQLFLYLKLLGFEISTEELYEGKKSAAS
jgi:uncharacterized damage-inducible protein DinB